MRFYNQWCHYPLAMGLTDKHLKALDIDPRIRHACAPNGGCPKERS